MTQIKASMTQNSGYFSSDEDMLDEHVKRHAEEHNWQKYDSSETPEITVLQRYGDPSKSISENARQMMNDIGFLDEQGIALHDAKYASKTQQNKRYNNFNGYLANRTKMIRKGLTNDLSSKNQARRTKANIQLHAIKGNKGILSLQVCYISLILRFIRG